MHEYEKTLGGCSNICYVDQPLVMQFTSCLFFQVVCVGGTFPSLRANPPPHGYFGDRIYTNREFSVLRRQIHSLIPAMCEDLNV